MREVGGFKRHVANVVHSQIEFSQRHKTAERPWGKTTVISVNLYLFYFLTQNIFYWGEKKNNHLKTGGSQRRRCELHFQTHWGLQAWPVNGWVKSGWSLIPTDNRMTLTKMWQVSLTEFSLCSLMSMERSSDGLSTQCNCSWERKLKCIGIPRGKNNLAILC